MPKPALREGCTDDRPSFLKWLKIMLSSLLIFVLTACNTSPQVMAEQRMFRNLSLEFLGEYQLARQNFRQTPVGGLSDIIYDRQTDQFYAVSDDRSLQAPARFYTLNMTIETAGIERVSVEDVTLLKNSEGETYAPGSIDGEGIALSPRGTVFISSEGSTNQGIAPFIREHDLKTGQAVLDVPLPQRYLASDSEKTPRGLQDNLGFEPLAISAPSLIKDDPFRLFTATEAALIQDSPGNSAEENSRIRFLHYLIDSLGTPVLLAEHLYILDSPPEGALSYGLTALTALDEEGYFLSLERTFGLSGFGAKIFQLINANATDTSGVISFAGGTEGITPLKKKLLLDLSELGIELDNLEGMALGPRLADGSQTLVLVSDDNFRDEQVTQFLLFRLQET
jgi:hypothetical protein